MIRLNGWQRIGVIISVMWAMFILGTASYQYFKVWQYERMEANCEELFDNKSADKSIPEPSLKAECLLTREKVAKPEVFYVLVATILPIISLWLLAYGVVRVTKWIINGFKSQK